MSGMEIPLLLAAGGAFVGSQVDKQDPLRGALLGGAAGFTGGSALAPAAAGATGAGAAAGSVAAIEGTAGAASAMGTASPFATSVYQAAVPGLTMTGPGSQAAMLAAQTGEFGLQGLASTAGAGGSPFFSALAGDSSINPMQAMRMQRSLGGFGQQQGTQTPSTQIKQRREVNLADPIASLLAPKRKKERSMISLL
jgi:hypothetical protein